MWYEPKIILAYSEPIDMRKSFDSLLGLAQGELREDPLSETVFVLINKRANYLKAIYWDRTSFCLFAKRLERGSFKFPTENLKQELSNQILKLILDGIQLCRRRKIR